MSLLPRWHLDTTVAIEIESREGGQANYRTIRTGFLVGLNYGDRSETGEVRYRIFTVTNRHVLAGKDAVWVRLHLKGGTSKRYKLILKDEEGKTWLVHPDPEADVAVVKTPVRTLREEGIEFHYFLPENIAFTAQMKDLGIGPGQEVFVLGFPMGMSGRERNYVIARSGIVARFDDEILAEGKGFLIDSSVFPGNSGGPVVVKPTEESLVGAEPIIRAYLIGVVKGYIPYEEMAYSLHTQPPTPRVSFVENLGLAYVTPIDFVKEATDILEERQRNAQESLPIGIEVVAGGAAVESNEPKN